MRHHLRESKAYPPNGVYWMQHSEFYKAISAVRAGELRYREILEYDLVPRGTEDVQALADTLRDAPPEPWDDQDPVSDLCVLADLFRAAEDEHTELAMERIALPDLLDVYDEAIDSGAFDVNDLMLVLRVFAFYGGTDGLDRIIEGVERFPDHYEWDLVFEDLEGNDEISFQIVEALSDPPPPSFAGAAYLGFVNDLCSEAKLGKHPFDQAAGYARIQDWLTEDDCNEDFAHTAAAALAYLSGSPRDELLELALDHPSDSVRMEAAWAQGVLGREEGLEELANAAADPRTSLAAMDYLDDLEASDRVPEIVGDPDFTAMAEMCDWLRHPDEYGRAPDEVSIIDSRTLYWPPTDDMRELFVVYFSYAELDDEEEVAQGQGLVGSVTGALLDEDCAGLTPEELYALHCCWELDINEDPRAPDVLSVEAGFKLLRSCNPDFEAGSA